MTGRSDEPLVPTPNGTKSSPDLGGNMTKKFLWVLVLILIGFQSGCAVEKYPQVSTDYSGLRYAHEDSRSGPQFGPSPG